MATTKFEQHTHQEMVHAHDHIHLTHHAKGGGVDNVEHLVAQHSHEHNHATIEHAHEPHENPEREHEHEAHTHDHNHPASE